MMRVTSKVLNEKVKNHETESLNKTGLLIQRKCANGKWSKPYLTKRFGNETNIEIINRLQKLNNIEYKIAE